MYLRDGVRAVRVHAAEGQERERLVARWCDFSASADDLDAYAARRPSQTAVVVLEPRTEGMTVA